MQHSAKWPRKGSLYFLLLEISDPLSPFLCSKYAFGPFFAKKNEDGGRKKGDKGDGREEKKISTLQKTMRSLLIYRERQASDPLARGDAALAKGAFDF